MQTPQPAQGPLLAVAQISILNVTLVVMIAALMVATASLFIVAIRTKPQGQRPWLDYGSFFVVICGIAAVIIGFLSILLVLGSFKDVNQALGFLTAFFGAVVGLVGTFFGIKSSADATAGAQKASADATAGAQKLAAVSAGDTAPPQVLETNPPDRDQNVSPNIRPTATFSKDMDGATINAKTFKVLDQVTGNQVEPLPLEGVVYDETTKVATFIPRVALRNGRRYGATITSGVKDKAGNALAQDKAWHFTVANGQQAVAAQGPAAQEGAAAEDEGAAAAQEDAGEEPPKGQQRDS